MNATATGGGGSLRRRPASSKPYLCGHTLHLVLLLCVISVMPYWALFAHFNSFYNMLFHGVRFTERTAHIHYGYAALPYGFGNNTFEGHHDGSIESDDDDLVGNLVAENIDSNRSLAGDGFPDVQDQEEDEREKSPSAFVYQKWKHPPTCATVEEMGVAFAGQGEEDATLRVRRMIQHHFSQLGAPRIRELPPEQFCRQNFVFGRSSEAGFGNEMYKILTAAGLSLLLNRSLLIGENRAKLAFGDYLSYSNQTFSLKEIRLLWARNNCAGKYKRPLVMRIDDFEMPTRTSVLCEDWRKWKQPIVWFKGTTDTVAIQFFLKNIHPGMRDAAKLLLGDPRVPSSRPNLFGELMKVLISPAHVVEEAVNWTLNGGRDPDVTLHMRMRVRRSKRALDAAVRCIKKSLRELSLKNARPRVVLVTDTPSIVEHMKQDLRKYAEVLQFDYNLYTCQNATDIMNATHHNLSQTRVKDWGPMPRWVAFVDFFLASRATHAVVSGAHRRVATTYAQLIAAMSAANKLDITLASPRNFSFYSSFQSNLLGGGLGNQLGWGHAWNRFGGQLSCHNQPDQCALTPLLPPGWWDGPWQSPIPRDIRRLKNFGVYLNETGEYSETSLLSFCKSRKVPVNTVALVLPSCKKCIKN